MCKELLEDWVESNSVAQASGLLLHHPGSSPLATRGWRTKSLWDFPRTRDFFVSQF
jgi:hypothetical protein